MVHEVESTIKQIAVIRFQRSEDAYVMQRNRLLAGGLSKRQNNETEVSTSICSTGSRSISCRLSAAAVQIGSKLRYPSPFPNNASLNEV